MVEGIQEHHPVETGIGEGQGLGARLPKVRVGCAGAGCGERGLLRIDAGHLGPLRAQGAGKAAAAATHVQDGEALQRADLGGDDVQRHAHRAARGGGGLGHGACSVQAVARRAGENSSRSASVCSPKAGTGPKVGKVWLMSAPGAR